MFVFNITNNKELFQGKTGATLSPLQHFNVASPALSVSLFDKRNMFNVVIISLVKVRAGFHKVASFRV
jgi:hypothetical protein